MLSVVSWRRAGWPAAVMRDQGNEFLPLSRRVEKRLKSVFVHTSDLPPYLMMKRQRGDGVEAEQGTRRLRGEERLLTSDVLVAPGQSVLDGQRSGKSEEREGGGRDGREDAVKSGVDGEMASEARRREE